MRFAIAAMYCFVLSNLCVAQNYIDPEIFSINKGDNSWDTEIEWNVVGGSSGDNSKTDGALHDPLSGTETAWEPVLDDGEVDIIASAEAVNACTISASGTTATSSAGAYWDLYVDVLTSDADATAYYGEVPGTLYVSGTYAKSSGRIGIDDTDVHYTQGDDVNVVGTFTFTDSAYAWSKTGDTQNGAGTSVAPGNPKIELTLGRSSLTATFNIITEKWTIDGDVYIEDPNNAGTAILDTQFPITLAAGFDKLEDELPFSVWDIITDFDARYDSVYIATKVSNTPAGALASSVTAFSDIPGGSPPLYGADSMEEECTMGGEVSVSFKTLP